MPSPTQDDDLKFREPPSGQCAYYNGKICSAHIHRQFWINNTLGNAGGVLNEQITTGLWHEIISGLSEPCRTPAEVSSVVRFLYFSVGSGKIKAI